MDPVGEFIRWLLGIVDQDPPGTLKQGYMVPN